MSVIEIYDRPFPKEVGQLPPIEGYVTFLGVDVTDRMECMDAAVHSMMGTADGALKLSKMPHRFLLQCFRIDDTETTVLDFAHAMTRIFSASNIGIGPKVYDAWMAVFDGGVTNDAHRTAYGFALLHKPSYTLAEFSTLHSDTNKDWLVEAVRAGAPLVRDLVTKIAEGGFCWPGPIFDPHGIGIYADDDEEPKIAVVTDWSSCVMGAAPAERIMAPLLENYKKFLEQADKSPIDRHRDLFYEVVRNLV